MIFGFLDHSYDHLVDHTCCNHTFSDFQNIISKTNLICESQWPLDVKQVTLIILRCKPNDCKQPFYLHFRRQLFKPWSETDILNRVEFPGAERVSANGSFSKIFSTRYNYVYWFCCQFVHRVFAGRSWPRGRDMGACKHNSEIKVDFRWKCCTIMEMFVAGECKNLGKSCL